ncbi:hypothetical protein CHARACLAT_007855 [Characodon lateralis]|uniref:USP domain-containing protein n=1 Tax=Characodon lateralis TaxID=208331 RepID=A0ABU7CVS9_9TELE|nr:hypothetical protein [Characodon lateralis]
MQIHFVIKRKIEDRKAADTGGAKGRRLHRSTTWGPADTVIQRRGRQRPTHNTGGGRKKSVSATILSGDAHGVVAPVGIKSHTLRVLIYLLNITELNPVYRGFCSSEREPGCSDMVIYADWQQAAVEPRSDSCLPMTGEGTGLEALASPQAGYLGKVQERAASLEYCPWCSSKGLTYALRCYRIKLQESIALCTNPQCLFPLVTRPLEDILASLDPLQPTVGNKRKSALVLEEEEVVKSPLKRQQSSDLRPESISSVPGRSLEHCSLHPVTNGQVNGYHKESPDVETTEWDNEDVQNKDDPAPSACSDPLEHSSDVLLASSGAQSPALSPHFISPDVSRQDNVPGLNCRLNSSQASYSANIQTSSPPCNEQPMSTEKDSLMADIPPCQDINGFHSESRDLSDQLVSVPKQLLWKNSDSLCWLDSLLVVLVNCKSLRKLGLEHEPRRSSVWRLLREHEAICAAVQAHQQTGRDGVLRVPSHVLQNAYVDLQSLRTSVFKLLQPKLHCKMGQRETPVFAMPLLLTLDSWVERLFQTTYLWDFKCSECKVITKERVIKTLPTFTNILPDWTPLNAVHLAPCNMCCKKNQMRTMLLESISPVFALHFVEGLPDNDVSKYTFSFKGNRYSVTTVIQYSHRLRHFVTWIYNEDGLWLECDDLKYPECKTYQQLQIPSQEIHVVFWEAEEDGWASVCSSFNALLERPPAKNEGVPNLKDFSTEEPSVLIPDYSLLTSHSDTNVVCALSGDDSTKVDTTVTYDANTSIGASTLLDTFEGLTHNDIITITLMELQPDSVQSEKQSLMDTQQTENPPAPLLTEEVISSPDSSVLAAGGDLCHSADAEPTPTSSQSQSESGDSSAGDPTFVCGAKRRRGRRPKKKKTVGRQRGKKATSSKDAPQGTPDAPSEPPKPVCSAENNTAPITEQTSTTSSTNNLPPSSTQNDRWSFLLSKHPLNQFKKNISHLPPTQNLPVITEVNPSQPVHSTPNPVKKPPIPSRIPKAPLLKEEGTVLPPKAAEMYGGFGAKSSNPSITLSSPLSIPPLPPAVLPNRPTPLAWTSDTSPPSLHENSSIKKPGSSKVPLVLSDTEALRYKLLKKLKAKKKKLAKLNQLLGNGGGAHLRPDSTDLNSPSTVSSSTYDGSTCDDILSDLLSPATATSHLSPDSTGFFEMLASGQDGANQPDCVVSGARVVSQTNCRTSQHEDHNFLEEFFSQL